ncbi:E3 ubiquitin-protein ligase TRIM11-like [Aulostomus maculatus]
MSAACSLQSEDSVLCAICLDVFTDPVTTSCGHNFCKSCITAHWNTDDQYQYQCPMCKEMFPTRPDLKVNTLLCEMVAQFRGSSPQVYKPVDIQCDVCPGTKLKAVKSCLVCLVSFCEIHLEPHLRVSVLKKHHLVDPVENLEGRMCRDHNKPLELFCRSDQIFVCLYCSFSDHKTHDVVPMKEESEGKKADLEQMIQDRCLRIQQIQHSVDLGEEYADREIEEGVKVFTALKESVEKGLNELIGTIEEKRKIAKNQAEDLIRELQEEISVLMARRSEMEQLSRTEDHLYLLQSSLKAAPSTKDWTDVSVRPMSYEGKVVKTVAQLLETLNEDMRKLIEAELKRLQQYEVDVTVDPDTAHPQLIISHDRKQVHHGDVKKILPDKPQRLSYVGVLGKPSFSSGKLYFEVQVRGKTDWTLGVAKESINRKKFLTTSPEHGFWTICVRNGNEYKAQAVPPVGLCLKSPPQRVGVFVDHDEGLVSFYDVDASVLIYSFTGCNFSDTLLPILNPCSNERGRNATPLIICPVNQTYLYLPSN